MFKGVGITRLRVVVLYNICQEDHIYHRYCLSACLGCSIVCDRIDNNDDGNEYYDDYTAIILNRMARLLLSARERSEEHNMMMTVAKFIVGGRPFLRS